MNQKSILQNKRFFIPILVVFIFAWGFWKYGDLNLASAAGSWPLYASYWVFVISASLIPSFLFFGLFKQRIFLIPAVFFMTLPFIFSYIVHIC
jgi:hypothetical protein